MGELGQVVRAGEVQPRRDPVRARVHRNGARAEPATDTLGGPARLGHVVPAALHRPDGVPVGSEGLRRVCGLPGVDHHRHAVDRDDDRADVVVVVVLAVVPALDRERQPGAAAAAFAHQGDLHVRQPDPLDQRRRGRRGGAPVGVGQRGQRPTEAGPLAHRRPAARRPVRGGVPDDVLVAQQRAPPVQHVPGLVGRRARGPVAHVEVPAPAQLHPVREPGRLAEHRHRARVELAGRGPGEQVERLQRAAGPVPPVAVALVDPAVGRQRREVPVQTRNHQRDDVRALAAVEEGQRCDQHVPMDPRVPVVHVAVEPEPVPVAAGGERLEHPAPRLGAHPLPDAGSARVERCAEHMVDPGQLAGDLPGPEVQVRVVQGRGHAAVPRERVVVRGPAPAALLAQQHDAVRHLVDPPLLAGPRGHQHGAGQALLAGADPRLVVGPVPVAEVARVVRGQRLRPRGGELRPRAPGDRAEGRRIEAGPERPVGRGSHARGTEPAGVLEGVGQRRGSPPRGQRAAEPVGRRREVRLRGHVLRRPNDRR